MVNITIVGTGYVGLVTGTCLAEAGHKVICSDVSEKKIAMLKAGEIPIYEPGLKELVEKNVKLGKLSFTTDVAAAVRANDVVFSAVGTPPDKDHKADLQFVRAVAKTFAENLTGFKVFVNKSTVPVGTADMVSKVISEITEKEFAVASNPEFLREGCAVEDFMEPDRIVIGTEKEKARELMKQVYAPFEKKGYPIVFTDIKSAELIKYASNSFIATKISFINEIANFCELVGADVKAVAKGMGYDERIGSKYLHAGVGYGGSCFPKDVKALIESGKENSFPFRILESVEEVNEHQKGLGVDKLKAKLGSLEGKRIAVWGLAFKNKTDDIRESPALTAIARLLEEKADVVAFDFAAMDNVKEQHPEFSIEYASEMYEAAKGAEALLVMTDWQEFRFPDYAKLKEVMSGNVLVDGKNCMDLFEAKEAGFDVQGFGQKLSEKPMLEVIVR